MKSLHSTTASLAESEPPGAGFSTQNLLAWSALVAFYLAALHWILHSENFDHQQTLPLAWLGNYVLGFGMLIGPSLFAGCSLALIIVMAFHRVLPYTFILFSAIAWTTIVLNLAPGFSSMESSHRCLLVLAVSLVAGATEFAVRRQNRTVVWCFGLSLVGMFSYYTFLLAVQVLEKA